MNGPGILKTIQTTEDDNYKLHIKLLTSLIETLASKMPRERDEIVISSALYEKAHRILSLGISEDRTRVLSYLTVLLRMATRSEDPTRAPAARELLHRSGCLQDMLDLFLSTEMTKPESLNVLCECLVESCKNSELNQNYCCHLIPACLQRCDPNNNAILKLLHCLLLNNTRNINIFVECNGISTIFTRNSLQDRSGMELLSIVAQNSNAANILKRATDLKKFLFTLAKDHKMVEWVTDILLHIESHIEDTDDDPDQKPLNITEIENEIKNVELSSSDLSLSFLYKSYRDKIQITNMIENNNTGNMISEHILENSKKSCVRALSDDQISLHSRIEDSVAVNDFKPEYTSTPRKSFEAAECKDESNVAELNKGRKNRKEQKSKNDLPGKLCGTNSAPVVKKKLSTTACLFKIVNDSCISIYNMLGNVFSRSALNKCRREDLLKPSSSIKAETPNCRHNNSKGTVHLSRQKPFKKTLGIHKKYYKGIIKKLKTGMYFYGCNFKKIAQAMWPEEEQMTAQVLYSIYKKHIVRSTYGNKIK